MPVAAAAYWSCCCCFIGQAANVRQLTELRRTPNHIFTYVILQGPSGSSQLACDNQILSRPCHFVTTFYYILSRQFETPVFKIMIIESKAVANAVASAKQPFIPQERWLDLWFPKQNWKITSNRYLFCFRFVNFSPIFPLIPYFPPIF